MKTHLQLEQQIALNALSQMKPNGRAAIIIGGNMEYRDNGVVKDNVAFWTYLYNLYNVKGVVDIDGKLYQKQGTTYSTRMILIDGKRTEEEIAQSTVYPPTKDKAWQKASTFDELYNIVSAINKSNKKTNGTEILRSAGSPVVTDTEQQKGTLLYREVVWNIMRMLLMDEGMDAESALEELDRMPMQEFNELKRRAEREYADHDFQDYLERKHLHPETPNAPQLVPVEEILYEEGEMRTEQKTHERLMEILDEFSMKAFLEWEMPLVE